MAYEVKKSNDVDVLIISNNTINTETSLQLIGKNLLNYGDPTAENFVHLLENFSHDTPPANPISGQLFYDNSEDRWKYYTGTEWKYLTPTIETVEMMCNNGNMHSVTVVNDIDATPSAISIYSSEEFILHATDSSTDEYREQFAYIGAGVTLSSGMKFHGTAIRAEYADVAEYYVSDVEYEPGTILELGGTAEVTQTVTDRSMTVFGVVSTNPAYLMNSALMGTRAAVALVGRVPCKVTGIVGKGDRLVSSDIPGVARAASENEMNASYGSIHWSEIIGRSLENKTTDSISLIEVIIGNR